MAFIFTNPNPEGKLTDDCTIRALSLAMHKSWDDVYAELALTGFMLKDMMEKNSVWGRYLIDNGFKRYSIPNTCPDCYTIRDFCFDNKTGTFIVATGSHVVAVIDGNYYDTWDSGGETILSMFRKEE